MVLTNELNGINVKKIKTTIVSYSGQMSLIILSN
jgi:hypothetical protein